MDTTPSDKADEMVSEAYLVYSAYEQTIPKMHAPIYQL